VLAVWTQADGQLTVTGAVVRPDESFSSPTQLGVAGDDCWMHRCLAGGMGSVALGADGRGVIAWVEKANPYRANGGVVYARTVDVGGL